MFVSIKKKKFLGLNSKTELYEYEFELTDSEFGTVVTRAESAGEGAFADDVGIIISEYSKRNLNVASNLMKLIIFNERKYNWSINAQLNYYRKYQLLFSKEIEEELQKYLVLV